MAVKPKRPMLPLLSVAAWLTVSLSTSSVSAEEFLCDATQASNTELPVLDAACPIGNGLWGTKPKGSESSFWIQCGVFSQPLSLDKAKVLYQHISTDVWAKPEGKGVRCLIGPYDEFTKARADLAKVKSEPSYKEAFIREVVKGAPTTPPAAKRKAQPVEKAKPSPKPTAKTQTQHTTVLPAPIPSKIESANVERANSEPQDEILIRLTASINGVEYKVPYTMFGNDQFYMEHGLPWNRMNYEDAYKTCYRLGMRLASEQEWQNLLAAEHMGPNKWPMHLPYWGSGRTGLFASGKVNQLKGTSLLNVMCVK